jgi:putative membrane protein
MATSDVTRFFSEADRAEIQAAVREAERRTSGEIVPYAVSACDDYEVARWRGAALGALACGLVAAAAHYLGGYWGALLDLWIAVPPVIGAGVGYLAAALSPTLRRLLIPSDVLQERVDQRAAAAFLQQEVFATRERTGVLILVALFERRVVVLGDSGINAKVEQREWDDIVAGIVAGIRAGTPGKALAAGIRACGVLLERPGITRRTDDTDELADHLRIDEA